MPHFWRFDGLSCSVFRDLLLGGCTTPPRSPREVGAALLVHAFFLGRLHCMRKGWEPNKSGMRELPSSCNAPPSPHAKQGSVAERLAAAGGVKPSLVDAYRALLTGKPCPCPRVQPANNHRPLCVGPPSV